MTRKDLLKSFIVILADCIKYKKDKEELKLLLTNEHISALQECFGKYCLISSLNLSYMYRHLHIARCELRGRSREEIEIPAKNNKPNDFLITKIKEFFVDPLKMYVVVRKDMNQSQQAVQAGHALAEYLKTFETDWKNGIIVYLSIENEEKLLELHERLNRYLLKNIFFREEDMNQEITALACVTNNYSVFKQYSLL